MFSSILSMFTPFIKAAASPAQATVQTPALVTQIIGWVGGIGGGIVAIFLIVSLVKDAIAFANGSGSNSIWKIVGKVLFLILMIGLIFLAMNYGVLGNTAKDVADKVLNEGNNVVGGMLGGGTP